MIRLPFLALALAVTACTREITPEPEEPGDFTKDVTTTHGGKTKLRKLFKWIPLVGSGYWSEVDPGTEIPPGSRVLPYPTLPKTTGAALLMTEPATAVNGSAALFTGGIESNTVFATRTAILIEPAATGTTVTPLLMNVARIYHTVTPLPGERGLIAGGFGAAALTVHASAEIYDIAAKAFTPTGSMRLARGNHAAAAFPDGRVLVAGGEVPLGSQQGTTFSATTEIYDPTSGTFSDGPNMTVARANHSAIALNDGRVLVLGGNTHRTAEVLAGPSGSFTRVGDMAVVHGQGHVALKLASGKVLVLGGTLNVIDATAVAELFDPVTNSFSPAGNMTTPRRYHFAVMMDDGKVLIGGGQNAVGDVLKSAEIYDPVAGTFTPVADMPLPGMEQAAAFISRGSITR